MNATTEERAEVETTTGLWAGLRGSLSEEGTSRLCLQGKGDTSGAEEHLSGPNSTWRPVWREEGSDH